MAKGISLHIGLNAVDPTGYEGWSGELTACEADANDMAALAKKQGFAQVTKLLTAKATSTAVSKAIQQAAAKLTSGDIFFLSYSGHGGQVPDENNDEDDHMDETWVLHDRMLVDDELYALYSTFKKGVRIIVLSDSCHSGTVIRFVPDMISGRRSKRMPLDANKRTYLAHKRTYDTIQRKLKQKAKARVGASVLLISGCQDDQTSADGERNGLFTEKLRKVWNDAAFKGNYSLFHKKILALMPRDQQPNYFRTGRRSARFEGQKPFTV